MPERPLKPEEMAALAESLRRLMAAIRNGEMAASAGMVHRLEGALAALNGVLAGGGDIQRQ